MSSPPHAPHPGSALQPGSAPHPGSAPDSAPHDAPAAAPLPLTAGPVGPDVPPPGWVEPDAGYLYAAVVPRRPAPARVHLAPPPSRSAPVLRAAQRAGAVVLVGALAVVGQSAPVGTAVQFVDRTLGSPAAPLAAASGVRAVEGGLVLAASTGALVAGTPTAEGTSAPAPGALQDLGGGGGEALGLVPAPVLAAYRAGATYANGARPGCGLSWSVLAGIGELESRHARAGGSGRPGWDGTASPPILGPVLDGGLAGTAVVRDTDGGRLDGDAVHDRALGPMQVLPGTWAAYAVDGNGDGRSDPQHVADAAAAAGLYLCDDGADLTDARRLVDALHRYNRSTRYVRAVLAAAGGYLAASLGPTPAGVAQAALAFAWKSLGDPYLWGGNGPLYDCSGLTTAAYRSAGILLPRTAGEQWQQVPAVPLGQLVVGDLVFFGMGQFRPGVPGHVGLYLGGGLMLNAPRTGALVRLDTIDRPGIVGAARPSLLARYTGAPLPGAGLVLPAVDGPVEPTPVGRPEAAPGPTAAGTATPSAAATAAATGPSSRPAPATTPPPLPVAPSTPSLPYLPLVPDAVPDAVPGVVPDVVPDTVPDVVPDGSPAGPDVPATAPPASPEPGLPAGEPAGGTDASASATPSSTDRP